jgi:hypothetical protein
MSDLSFLVSAPLRLEVENGRIATITRWSLEGFEPPLGLDGAEGRGRLTIPFNGFDISFNVNLRRDENGRFMRFVDLGLREDRLLRHFYREIVSGRAEPIDQMICAMDIPVEPIPMQQTPEEQLAAPRAAVPRPMRAAAVVALYIGLGAMLYVPVISPVWNRVSHMAEGRATFSPVETANSEDLSLIERPIVWDGAPSTLQPSEPKVTLPVPASK